jgi:hypothetical protein
MSLNDGDIRLPIMPLNIVLKISDDQVLHLNRI